MATPIIGAASYAVAFAAFLFLFVLVVASWRGRPQGLVLAMACASCAAWAGLAAYIGERPDQGTPALRSIEVLRSASWLAFLVILLGNVPKLALPKTRAALAISALCATVLVIELYAGLAPGIAPENLGILGLLLVALVGIVLVEKLYRSVAPQRRWGIKFLCLGLGALFVYDFYLYSDALLLGRVSPDIWAARGMVNAMIVPLIAVATARNPSWSVEIAVSRRVVFYSTAVVGAAVYLLVMAATGYYIRYIGNSWGNSLEVIFLFGAALLLLVILSSGNIRTRLKVFLSRNFFSYHYDYREEWLRFTNTLSKGEPGVQLYVRSIEAIAELADSPGGSLWLSEEEGVFETVTEWNVPPAEARERRDSDMCQFLETHQQVINLDEVKAHPERYDGLSLPVWLDTVSPAWLVVPLILHERLIGFVLLAPSRGNIPFNWEVRDILMTAGRQAASHLAQLSASRALLVSRQFESFNRMSTFLVHDLKNLVSQQSLLLSNAVKHRHKPEFLDDMFETIAQSVEKMKRLLLQLRGDFALESSEPVLIKSLLRQSVDARSGLRPVPRLEDGDGAGVSVVAHRVRLERVFGHLIQNAIEATPRDGNVVVKILLQDGFAVTEIADTGCGMSEHFVRHQLFKPFESTKAAGMGVGTYEAREYVRELGGRIEVDTSEARGTIFRVFLPEFTSGANPNQGVTFKGQE